MEIKEFKKRYAYDAQKDLIGKGGFGRVYKAYDTVLDRTIAIKFLKEEAPDAGLGLLQEIRNATKCDSPNLLKYYEYGVLELSNADMDPVLKPFIVMEYANAGTLNSWLEDQKLTHDLRKLFARQLLEAIAHLHKRKLAHRDLNPNNIFIIESEGQYTLKVADFGLSKNLDHTHTQVSTTPVGTLGYLPPELIDPETYSYNGMVSLNQDLWPLGLIILELFIGKRIFLKTGQTTTSHGKLIQEILNKDLRPLIQGLPPVWKDIVASCLERKAGIRPGNAMILLKVLQDSEKKSASVQQPAQPIRVSAPAPVIPSACESEMSWDMVLMAILLIVLSIFSMFSLGSSGMLTSKWDRAIPMLHFLLGYPIFLWTSKNSLCPERKKQVPSMWWMFLSFGAVLLFAFPILIKSIEGASKGFFLMLNLVMIAVALFTIPARWFFLRGLMRTRTAAPSLLSYFTFLLASLAICGIAGFAIVRILAEAGSPNNEMSSEVKLWEGILITGYHGVMVLNIIRILYHTNRSY